MKSDQMKSRLFGDQISNGLVFRIDELSFTKYVFVLKRTIKYVLKVMFSFIPNLTKNQTRF